MTDREVKIAKIIIDLSELEKKIAELEQSIRDLAQKVFEGDK